MALLRYSLVVAAAVLFAHFDRMDADAATYVGWVWSDQLNPTTCYTPPAPWSYTSWGGSITICPVTGELGTYDVQITGFAGGIPDNVQVVAYDANPYYGAHYCEVARWSTGLFTGVTAEVWCYVGLNKSFQPGASYFNLLYQARSGGFGSSSDGIAFLWADQPSASSYTPNPSHQYNSTGGTNTIVREGTGNYFVSIPGLQSTYSDVQITEYATGIGRCNAVSWSSESGGGTGVNVQCYDYRGNAADREFTLAYAVNAPFGLTTPTHSYGAFAWANDSGSTAKYTPSIFYQYNGFQTGYLTAQKLGTGSYAVYIPGGLSYSSSDVLVTAYGNTGNFCNVDEWSAGTIYVDCWDQWGGLTDSLFDVAFQTAE